MLRKVRSGLGLGVGVGLTLTLTLTLTLALTQALALALTLALTLTLALALTLTCAKLSGVSPLLAYHRLLGSALALRRSKATAVWFAWLELG